MTDALNTPRDFVESGWLYQQSLGERWYTLTEQVIGAIDAIDVAPVTFATPVDLNIDYGSFTRPEAPEEPDFPELAVTLPDLPDLAEVATPDLDAAPVEPDFGELRYVRPTAPNRALPARPADIVPVLREVELPTAPTITLPDEPTFYDITLPEVPDLTVPEFDGTRPVRDFDVPEQTFAYAPVAYDDTFLTTIKDRLADMVANGHALPAHIETGLFNRLKEREDGITLDQQQQHEGALAARGLRDPGGIFRKGRERIAAENRRKTSSANRDLSIRLGELEHENVRTALAQGVGLEVSLLQHNTASNELALRAAEVNQRLAVEVFNAKVALHNAEWDGFKAEAQVYESRIRALNSQADLYRAEIEGQKAIGEVNESLTRRYAETVRSRDTLVGLYRQQVEAAVATGTLNQQTLDQGRLRLQAYEVDVNAWGKEQDGHRIQVEAALGDIRAYEALGGVYGRRVDAWRTKGQAYFDQGRFTIEAQVQQLERFRASLERARTDGANQLAAIEAKTRIYATRGSVYAAEGQLAAAESAAQDRNASLRMEGARLRVETAQKNLELTANHALKVIDQQIAVLQGKAQVVSNIAASTASGVNFGASYSGSLGVGYSYGRSFGYSGDTDDDNPEF